MARVVRRAMSASARRAPSRAVQRRARQHKVVMETITQEKKKLRSVICFEAQAPSGYTFIPAGNPLLTTSCKERCRKDGLQVYAVSTTPHMGTHNLSQHVHRIGYHFPSTVVAAACTELGLYLTSSGKAVPFHSLGSHQENLPASTEVDQITINTEARDAIRDLFPNIPDNDLNQIIKTAFQKGQRKVGTASELPLARRAQLAVVAHIRHLYTDYDRLLKQKSFHEARSEVEQVTLTKLIAWRGDDENGQTVLEDVFREVIVISDDDDSETEDEGPVPAGTNDQRVGILSSSRTQEIQTQPISAVHVTAQDPLREPSEEAPPGFRIVTRAPAQNSINRRGFNRYQAWNRALNRYRAEANGVAQVPPITSGKKQSPRYGKRPVVIHEIPNPPIRREVVLRPVQIAPKVLSGPIHVDNHGSRLLAILPTGPTPGLSHGGSQERRRPLEIQPMAAEYESRGRSPPLTTQRSHEIRLLDARPFSTANPGYSHGISYPVTTSHARPERFPPSPENKANAPVFVSGPQEIQQNNQSRFNQSRFGPRADVSGPFHPRSGPSREDAIPSIELMDPPGLAEKRRADGPLVHLTNRMSLRSVTPRRSQGENSWHAHALAPDSPDDHSHKRRRLVHYAEGAVNPRPDDWNNRPIPIPEGPRGPFCRDEVVGLPEPHSQNRIYLRRDPSQPAEQPLAVGHPHRRNPGPLAPSSVSSNTRGPLAQTHLADHYGPVPVHTQPTPPGYNCIVAPNDRTIGPPADASYVEVRPAHFGDRSPRLDRARLTKPEERPPIWKPYTDANLTVVHSAPSNGKLYADDFVRHVDYREARPVPVEYYIPRSRHQRLPHVEEDRGQPARTMIPDSHAPQDLPHPQSLTDNRHLRSPRVAPASHNQAPRHLNAGTSPREHHSKPSGASRDRRPGSGLGALRRVRDPRSFQMIEQNRPIYVQRVESQPPPQYAIPDGRPVVVMD